MNLYIRLIDGQPFEHPILEDNFKAAFPHVDVDNLPPEFARFERVTAPVIGMFEVYEGVSYQFVNGVYTDVHHVRQMNETETAAKLAELTTACDQGLQSLKQIANNALANASETDKPHWQAWLDALNAWVLVDVLRPNFPTPPRVDETGNVVVDTVFT